MMKILIVGNARYREILINKIVGNNVTCRNNIIELDDIDLAKQFLSNDVLSQSVKKHIDLIIADDVIDNNKYQLSLGEWLRSINQSFSGFNFRLSSIPIILCKKDIVQTENSYSIYNATVPFSEDANDLRIVSICERVVKSWRKIILDDLSILDIDLNVLEILGDSFKSVITQYNKISKEVEYYLSITKIVSREFISFPRILDYEWMSQKKIIEIENSLEIYQKIVKNLIKYNGKAYERQVLHKFYNEHEFFLTRDTYERQNYEKRHYISTTSHFHVPDYILQSPFPGYTTTSISEIKRHNIHFEFNPRRHQNFTNYSQNALNQASNYQDDFGAAGLFNNKFQMDLIIGLDDNLTEFIRRKISKHFSTINVTTHDNLISMVEDYCKRLKLLHAII